MINTQQVIVFLPLFKTTLPVNLTVVFQIIMSIAAFDIIDVTDFINSALLLPYTGPLSTKFEEMGFESLFIIYNLGSVTLFALMILFIMILIHATRKNRFHVKV